MSGMRFGLFVPQGWRHDLVDIAPAEHWQAMLRVARHADEGDAFTSVWVYDHFHPTPEPTDEAVHEAWSLMSALGASTDRVRLGQMCTCAAYRNPVYLGKVAVTADIVSGGRVEMGIGAGWYEHEWRAYGYGFPSGRERLRILDETVQVLRQLWTKGTATLHGTYVDVDGALCRPLPLQDGGIPLWIAGGGEQVTLRIAAQYAQYTNFVGTPGTFAQKSEALATHCREVGTDFDAITRSANYNVVIGETEADVADRLARLADRFSRVLTPNGVARAMLNYEKSPTVGTPEKIAEFYAKVNALGMTYAISYFPEAAYDLSGIELYEKNVIEALR